jgi:hypothetical protein
VRDMACLERLEPAVVHAYCEIMLAWAVPEVHLASMAAKGASKLARQSKPEPDAAHASKRRGAPKVRKS